MAKSLRSKSKQRVKRLRRVKFYEREKQKCWDKYRLLQDEKNGQKMVVEAANEVGNGTSAPSAAEVNTDAATDGPSQDAPMDVPMESVPKLSRKKLEKLMKEKNSRRTKYKTKRLGGKKSHAKW